MDRGNLCRKDPLMSTNLPDVRLEQLFDFVDWPPNPPVTRRDLYWIPVEPHSQLCLR